MKKTIRKAGKSIMTFVGKNHSGFVAKLLFFSRLHKWPNLRNPKLLNEKLTLLKLNVYNDDPLVCKCADKYSVRDFLKERGYENLLNKLYGVYDSPNDIDFDSMPRQFALKCVHGCAYNIIIDDKDKMDVEDVRKTLKKWQMEKYGYATAELYYTRIKPRIICEKYLCNKKGEMPTDYKFFCMNGKSVGCMVCSDRIRNSHNFYINFFDNDWNEKYYFKEKYRNHHEIKKPKNYKKMIEIAESLSEGFPFVRVDLYDNNGKIIFGEMTFTPACCCNAKLSREGDLSLGQLLEIKEC